jgi:hypothetical protein
MRLRQLAIGVVMTGLSAVAAEARPACDLLRQCAAELAAEMALGLGDGCGQAWPARTVSQYQRMAVTDFEAGETSGVNVCDAVFPTIAANTRALFDQGSLCRMPIACKPENYGDLPALPLR